MRCLATALFVAATAVAQSPRLAPWGWTEAEIRANLASGDSPRIAWAAHVAGARQERGVVADLLDLLPRLSSVTPDGERVVLHVLDALVRLDAAPSAEELSPHAHGSLRVPALVLAARRPSANRDYFLHRLSVLASQPDLEWRVCGNQLAALRHHGFAAFCAERIEFVLQVTVRDDVPKKPGC